MKLNEFNELYLHVLLDKLSKEDKNVFLLGDLNIKLLNYDQDTSTNAFLDLSSHLFLPVILFYILQPIRTRSNPKSLLDKKFQMQYPPI